MPGIEGSDHREAARWWLTELRERLDAAPRSAEEVADIVRAAAKAAWLAGASRLRDQWSALEVLIHVEQRRTVTSA